MAEKITNAKELLNEATRCFEVTFGSSFGILEVCAPGRVNLIGEHTDYNAGFVFPMALPLLTVIVGKQSTESNKCRVKSLSVNSTESNEAVFNIPSDQHKLIPSEPAWSNYVKGVVANFHAKVPAFDAVITSSVPMGGGLSSSAALEVATYTFLEAVTGSNAESPEAKALACQKAEHDFALVPCGIMDQFISTMGVNGFALLIDCRSLESSFVPLNDPNITFVIINSNVKHSLSGSEYSTRRNNCFSAAKIMNKSSLRESTLQDLENFRYKMEDKMVKRVRHVITEIQRTKDAVDALKKGDYFAFGALMSESHSSLRDDYEVSCPELDELVTIAEAVPGVYGSRMTGGGFGGCTVTFVKRDAVDSLIKEIKEKYSGNPTIFICSPSDGARVLTHNA